MLFESFGFKAFQQCNVLLQSQQESQLKIPNERANNGQGKVVQKVIKRPSY
jgi:hypothetical protein